MAVIPIVKQSVMISVFVLIMMLLIEYINVQTQGRWKHLLKTYPWSQYVLSALLGALPGCLGAFTIVSLYTHRAVSFGALVTVMIATSGDEAFVMFSLFPVDAVLLTLLIFVIGMAAGYVVDAVWRHPPPLADVHELTVHEESICHCFPREKLRDQLLHPSLPRLIFVLLFAVILALLLGGYSGMAMWQWKHITFTLITAFLLFVLATVPDHFLEEHLWRHILRQHLPRIFLWTFGALFLLQFVEGYIDVGAWVDTNPILVMTVAVLVGIVPESGPHLVFATMYAQGTLPFGILLANSVVQDGHGMLPLLATSRRVFVITKLINTGVGLLVGIIALLIAGMG